MSKVRLILITLLILLTVFVNSANSVTAADVQQGQQCVVSTDKPVIGNLYTFCQTLTIDGVVHGDVVALAGSITINGTVERDLTVVAGQVTVNGTVGGNLRAVSTSLIIAPGAHLTAAHADIAAIGLDTQVMAPLSGDLLVAGYQVQLGNAVSGDVRFIGAALAVTVNGQIDGSADIQILGSIPRLPDMAGISFMPQGLALGQTADNLPRIKGNLKYEAPEQASIGPGTVGGEVRFVQGATSGLIGSVPFSEVVATYIGRILRDLLALMAVGLIALLIAQSGLQDATRQLKLKARQSFGYGLGAVLLAFPAMGVLLLASVIILLFIHLLTLGELTLIVGIGLTTLNLLVIGGFWFVALFLGRLVVCHLIGQWLGRRILLVTDRATTVVVSLLIGVVAYSAMADLPVLGYGLIFNAIAVFFGMGAIIVTVRNVLFRPQMRTTPAIGSSPITALLPGMTEGYPPPPEDFESSPGMDNLPEGFTWFDS